MKARCRYSLKEDLTAVVMLIFIILWITTPIWILILSFPPPKFSIQVVGATAMGLDAAAQQTAPTTTTVFNMTLHATPTRRQMGRCYSNGEVAVRYSGHTVAWGRTMAFCVGVKEASTVLLVAWADGVSLPPALHERMAADWRADAAAELEVDVKLFRADDASGRPAWVSCKVMASGANYWKATKTFTPCTTFALENWASDILDHLRSLIT